MSQDTQQPAAQQPSFVSRFLGKTVFIIAVGLVAAGGVRFYAEKLPPSLDNALARLHATIMQQWHMGDVVPTAYQIPAVAGAATMSMLFLLFALVFAKRNPKTVAFIVLFVLGGGGYAYYSPGIIGEKTYPEFDNAIADLASLSQPPEKAETKIGKPVTIASGDTVCTTQEYTASAKYDTMLVLDPTTDVIYPGALIKGETIGTGEYTPIVADRKPITISASLENIRGGIAADVESPALSSVRSAIKKILNQEVTGSTAARNTFEIEEIHSAEQLQMAIGANYSYSGGVASVKAGFDFRTKEKKSRYLIKFMQSYYTVDMDLPKTPSDLFQSPQEIRLAMLGSVSPMYVASVTYGRMALVSIESDASESELQAALEASFSSGVHSGELDISGSHKQTLAKSKIKGTIIGGSGADASAIRNVDSLLSYIDRGGNWSHESPAAPISYKLRYLSDNSVGNIILASTYKVRNCEKIERKARRYRVTLEKLTCTMSDDEGTGADNAIDVMGVLTGTAVNYSGNNRAVPTTKTIWQIGRDASISMREYEGRGGTQNQNIDQAAIFEFDDPDTNRSYIKLEGTLIDADNPPHNRDDVLARGVTAKLFLNEIGAIPVLKTMHFNSDHGKVQAHVQFDLIR